MARTREVREQIVSAVLAGKAPDASQIDSLKHARVALVSIPRAPDGEGFEVALDTDLPIVIDLSYEIDELGKDLIFLEKGEDALYEHMGDLYSFFSDQVRDGTELLKAYRFRTFVTDRDGTVNNYCARYLTSIQSAYNAVFMTRFARRCVRNALMLTSAPLRDGGLLDVATAPPDAFIYAASKGREYLDRKGRYGTCPIEPRQETKLEELNRALESLLAKPHKRKFTLIGSGLQKKFGQTTVARQDIKGSVAQEESLAFKGEIEKLVSHIDPGGRHFRIEDTGLDVEIILTIGGEGGALKDFDKGDAVRFLDEALRLELSKGASLVCGDTGSDLPMVSACVERNAESFAVFATTNDALKEKLAAVTPRAFCVDAPDVVVAILNELAKAK